MIVSNFAIAQEMHGGGEAVREVDYRLQITNLNDRPITYLVEAHVNIDEGVKEANDLVSRPWPTAQRIDPGELMSRQGRLAGRTDSETSWMIRVCAGGSELFHVVEQELPSSSTLDDVEPLMGYVTVRIPALRQFPGNKYVQQSAHPVPTLLSASSRAYRPGQQRWLFTDVPGMEPEAPYYFYSEDDATTADIPLATPTAQVDIDPEPPPRHP
jgi:hypothetical protein